jgi:hypothetical protein
MKIKIKRTPNLKLKRKLTKKINVKAGYFASDKGVSPIDNEGDIDMVGLVLTLNDGTTRAGRNNKVKIPARPFMDISGIKMRKEALKIVIKGVKEVINTSKKMEDVGVDLANEGAGIIKSVISGTVSPRNSSVTIALKGFDDPLVEHGDMQKRAGAKVNNGSTLRIGDVL